MEAQNEVHYEIPNQESMVPLSRVAQTLVYMSAPSEPRRALTAGRAGGKPGGSFTPPGGEVSSPLRRKRTPGRAPLSPLVGPPTLPPIVIGG